MKPETPTEKSNDAADLRRRAQARLQSQPPPPKAPGSTDEMQRHLQELQTHQIELEMQNEELREARARLEASATRYTNLYNLAPVGYFTMGLKGEIIQANLAGARLLGLERSRLLDYRFDAFVASADLPAFRTLLTRAFASQPPETIEVRLAIKDKPPLTVLLQAYVSEDGLESHLVLTDITERRQAEVTLRASEERYRLLFENAGDMIFIHDEEGQTLDANPMAVKLFGYTRLELMSMTLHQIESPEAPLPTADRIARLLKEGHLTFETVLQCKDGSLVPTEVNTRRIVWDGEPTFLGICRDITKRKEAEEKLRQLSARLLRHRDEEQRHIARELHDVIGQNLAAMTINLDFLLTSADRLPPEARQALLDSEALAKQTAKEVRTFSFLLHPPLLEELGLGGALQDYVPGFARRSGIRVDLELPLEFGRMPQETELALFRVIQESLANIHRHSGSKTACITLNQTTDEVQLEVRDAGRGFVLTPSESAGPASPLGVGILGMQERLRQLGGRLHISSNSRGTIVRATLPCARKETDNPQ